MDAQQNCMESEYCDTHTDLLLSYDTDGLLCCEACDKEEEEEWMSVYNQGRFKEFCGELKHLRAYKNYHYYQCWGGGTEGGYITNNKKTYRVNRGWFKPFTVEHVPNAVIQLDNTTHKGFTLIRILTEKV